MTHWKQPIGWIAFIVACTIISPSYKCREYPEPCDRYVSDTLSLHFNVDQGDGSFQPFDTIHFLSVLNDTMRSNQGRNYIYNYGSPSLQIQCYKVVEGPSDNPVLVYANIEFNPLVSEGQFLNYYGQGTNLMYNRQIPYSRLRGAFVPGRPGLYLFVVRPNNYYNDYLFSYADPNGPRECINYFSKYTLTPAERLSNYWDTLGVTALTLQGDGYNVIAQKNESNHFFIHINP